MNEPTAYYEIRAARIILVALLFAFALVGLGFLLGRATAEPEHPERVTVLRKGDRLDGFRPVSIDYPTFLYYRGQK